MSPRDLAVKIIREAEKYSPNQPVWTCTSINDHPFWLMESTRTNAHSSNTHRPSHTIVFCASGHRISFGHNAFSAWETKINPRKHKHRRYRWQKIVSVCAHQYIKLITLWIIMSKKTIGIKSANNRLARRSQAHKHSQRNVAVCIIRFDFCWCAYMLFLSFLKELKNSDYLE